MEALRSWRTSGQSLPEFAKETGIEEHRLQRWVRRSGGSKAVAAPRMVPIRLVTEREASPARGDREKVASDGAMEIVVIGGLRVIVRRGFDSDELSRLLDVVTRA